MKDFKISIFYKKNLFSLTMKMDVLPGIRSGRIIFFRRVKINKSVPVVLFDTI